MSLPSRENFPETKVRQRSSNKKEERRAMISRATSRCLDYYRRVRPITISMLLVTLALAPALNAQVHGVPASVTSFGPGRGFAPGVPASVTSLGPNGFGVNPFIFGGTPVFFGDTNFLNGTLPDNQFFTRNCCASPVFPFRNDRFRNDRDRFRHNPDGFRHPHNGFNGLTYYPVAVPVYSSPYYPEMIAAPSDDSAEAGDAGPTMFDRNGQGFRPLSDRYPAARDQYAAAGDDARAAASKQAVDAATEPVKAAEQPTTVLVFKDGHKIEVKNYAVQGNVLYDLTPGHARKIPLSDLDLGATQKENDDRGNDFQLPVHSS
jgi:hypothetical protein